jgi:hypothetical protein
MNNPQLLIADADLEIIHESGSRISVQLEAGAGVIELTDNRLLRLAVRNFRTHRQHLRDLAPYLQLLQRLKGRVDISVGGWRVARLDSSKKADFICRHLGLPYCRIRPFGLLFSLFGSPDQSHTN